MHLLHWRRLRHQRRARDVLIVFLLLTFVIEWSTDSIHPVVDAPAGCRLQQLVIVSPHAEELSRLLRRIGIDAPVETGVKAELRAMINGPIGSFSVSS